MVSYIRDIHLVGSQKRPWWWPFLYGTSFSQHMIGPHRVAFLRGPKDIVLSENLGITNGDGADQVTDLTALLLLWGKQVVWIFNVGSHPDSPVLVGQPYKSV